MGCKAPREHESIRMNVLGAIWSRRIQRDGTLKWREMKEDEVQRKGGKRGEESKLALSTDGRDE